MIWRAPIVLVGGFTAWGREEAFGIKYWGGPGRDVQEDLKARGFPVVTAAPGPFSSNWDRAAEVYAQVWGGTVDYGEAHARRFGHARFGRTCPGLLPGGAAHFLGHSMGGQTIRVLAHLLAEGSEDERQATPEGLSPLFRGGQPGVLSLTTLATPHRGTTLARKREALADVARRILALAGGLGSPAVYDLKLDHWGLQRLPGESTVTSGFRRSSRSGTRQCCALQAARILGTPEPACSPSPIIWNIFWRLRFRQSLVPPAKARSRGTRRLPGFRKRKPSGRFWIRIPTLTE